MSAGPHAGDHSHLRLPFVLEPDRVANVVEQMRAAYLSIPDSGS